MCNQKFIVSKNESYEFFKLFYSVVFEMKQKCKVPCTQFKYTTRVQLKYPYNFTMLNIIFDRTLDVTKSSFSTDLQAFLTKLGGSVSMGRTVLWILVSLLGAAQVVVNLIFLRINLIFKVIKKLRGIFEATSQASNPV